MQRLTIGIGVALALTAAASCAGSAEDDTPMFGAEALVEYDRFLEALEARSCERAVLCGGQPDLAECRALASGASSRFYGQVRAGIEAGRTGIAVRAAAAFIDEYAPLDCVQRVANQTADIDSAFQAALPGRFAPGARCWMHNDCAGNSRCDLTGCDFDDTCCTGVCVAYDDAVGEGQPCSYRQCGPGLDCYQHQIYSIDQGLLPGSDTEPVCHPALPEGAACGESERCQQGTRCREDAAGELHCLRGSPRPGERCGAVGCANADHYCSSALDSPVRVCIPSVPVGGACASTDACLQHSSCVEGVCTLRPGLGEACDDRSFRYCLEGTDCNRDTNQCEVPAPFVPCEASRTPI